MAGIPADPNDPEDFDVSEAEVQRALAERRTRRGAQRTPVKVPVSIRLSPDVVTALRQTGTGWQTRADGILREGLGLGSSQVTGEYRTASSANSSGKTMTHDATTGRILGSTQSGKPAGKRKA